MPLINPEARNKYNREYGRKWYADHREKRHKEIVARKNAVKKWIQDYKVENGCLLCLENECVCLEFHHKDSSIKEVSLGNAGNKGWGLERVQKEILKCIVLCANCHRKVHAGIITL